MTDTTVVPEANLTVEQFTGETTSSEELRLIDAYWRAANYLSVGQIYLFDNPLLKESLRKEHIKPRLVGHWGTTPGLNFVYAHLNRAVGDREAFAVGNCPDNNRQGWTAVAALYYGALRRGHRLLPRLGYEVVGEARTGVELVALCRAENPDLVITDIMMPDNTDGIAAVTEIAKTQNIPFIIVSSHDGPTDRMDGQIIEHLVKPITIEMLQAAIEKPFPRRIDSDTSA